MVVLQQNLVRARKVQEQSDKVPNCGMHALLPSVLLASCSKGSRASVPLHILLVGGCASLCSRPQAASNTPHSGLVSTPSLALG